MRHIRDRSGAGGRRAVVVAAAALAALLGAGACSDILDVELPGRIQSGLLDDAKTATGTG